MTFSGEQLLSHFDRLTRAEPKFVRVSDEGVERSFHVATYSGFPKNRSLTGFTLGLSHYHVHGGSHKELTISMNDASEVWALACGFVALQLCERCPFNCGETINFEQQIAPSSQMSAFVVVHPQSIAAADSVVELGGRRVEIMQLVPLYERERTWLLGGGEVELFLKQFSGSDIMDPARREFEP